MDECVFVVTFINRHYLLIIMNSLEIENGIGILEPYVGKGEDSPYRFLLLGTNRREYWVAIQSVSCSISSEVTIVNVTRSPYTLKQKRLFRALGLPYKAVENFWKTGKVFECGISVKQHKDGFFYGILSDNGQERVFPFRRKTVFPTRIVSEEKAEGIRSSYGMTILYTDEFAQNALRDLYYPCLSREDKEALAKILEMTVKQENEITREYFIKPFSDEKNGWEKITKKTFLPETIDKLVRVRFHETPQVFNPVVHANSFIDFAQKNWPLSREKHDELEEMIRKTTYPEYKVPDSKAICADDIFIDIRQQLFRVCQLAEVRILVAKDPLLQSLVVESLKKAPSKR